MPFTVLLAAGATNYLIYGGIALGVLLVIVFGAFFTKFAGLWIQGLMARADIGFFDLVAMYFRKVNPNVIVQAKITAVQAGISLQTRDLEAHYLAGGRVPNVVRALIAADRARITLDYKMATGIDLAGRDVLDSVQTSVNPKVIDCPDPKKGRTTLDAVAKNGIQLKVRARVTVRANIERLVGGATEETIIARVGEGIVSTIGAAETHKDVLEHPDLISRTVMQKGLDAGTAFEILSVDIADVDVGENIGARLQADQAEADKRIAQAKAEERRAMAVAREQEMKALVEENRAKVVLAEAEIPKGIAQAFREGNLGIMDYYRLRNVQADTNMRNSIGGTPGAPPKGP
ncbi:MAG: flotillin-like protein FloA [Planctomycetes bacterium]|jgi:uncharacterized protein YqfA (UPF0365 family)|nr:flotillin-like protein FloA [Planctomycetota bacterium]